MRLSPQIQVAMLEKAENQTLLDGLTARQNVLPERAELQELRKKHSRQASEAARSKLSASDIGRDIAKLESDINKLKAREKADRLSLGAAEDASTRRDLEHDLRSTKRRRERAEQELQQYARMQEAYQVDAEHEYDADEAHDDIVAAKQRLNDAEVDLIARISIAETRIEEADKLIDGSAAKLYRRLALANGIPVARLNGRTCGSCFMELDVGTVHEFTTLAPEEVTFCPECGAMIVRAETLGAVKGK